MSYFGQLSEFLRQAKTQELKTKHYKKEYLGTEVRVSFGQGNVARIPWISFLKKPNTTSNGIYPVYLYYKEYKLLILAYGVSETNKPNLFWSIKDKKSINEYFSSVYGVAPDRYGTSFIFKIYDLKEDLIKKDMNSDLNSIIEEYKVVVSNSIPSEVDPEETSFLINEFSTSCLNAGLSYSSRLLRQFASSLLTKPFVILTGLSGSGKTKLAQSFVQWICQDESQYRIIPVGADWTNREPLLGYPNALKPEEYVKPDNGALDLIIEASTHPDLPYFLILDEMNLSHVERYFADFLSVMESKEAIPLHAEEMLENGVPPSLVVPPNLFIIGTVNIDETTNMFSPKVLDRANTIEFRISSEEMEGFLENIKELNMDALNTKGASMAKSFLELSAQKKFASTDIELINKALVRFFEELKKTGAEFGYRSATEILRLINQLTVLDDKMSTNEKIDIAIIQKLLPKLHGSRRKLCPVLATLGTFCMDSKVNIEKEVFEKDNFNFEDSNVLYPLSLEKIARMYKGAIDNGFASFAEA